MEFAIYLLIVYLDTLSTLIVGLSMCGRPIVIKKCLIVATVGIFKAVVLSNYIPVLTVDILVTQILLMLALRFIYKENLFYATSTAFIGPTIFMAIETLYISVLLYLFKLDLSTIISTHWYMRLLAGLGNWVLMSVIYLLQKKYKLTIFPMELKKHFEDSRLYSHQKITTWLIVYVLSLGCTLVLYNSSLFAMKKDGFFKPLITPAYFHSLFNLLIILIVGLGIFLIRKLVNSMIEVFEKELSIQSLENERMLNQYFRMQKHDFRTHIMVISGLAQLKKLDDINKYISTILSDMQMQDSIGHTKFPVLDAFFYSKQKEAKDKQIKLSIEVNTSMEHCPITGVELCRIFGNLLDNSFYALEQCTEKIVEVDIIEESDNYMVDVYNSGSYIDESIMKHIFNPGFTTKKTKGTGMGLYIVKSLVKKYSGSISVKNQEMGGVVFTITFPKQKIKQA